MKILPLALVTAAATLPQLAHGAGAVSEILETVEPTATSNATRSAEPAILYINGCWDGGCDIARGDESSIRNQSSLIKDDVHVSSYSFGRGHFDQVVRCVSQIYAPFGVTVTDQDPGAVPHYETIVSGSPTSLGFPAEVGGVAPFSCDGVPNAISFVFPMRLDGDAQRICEAIAHESAHPFGLEHTYVCEDAMTYLDGCGDKGFLDLELPCGEDESRSCRCGGTTQNSHRRLVEAVGVANPTPPTVTMEHPRDGQALSPGFRVEATASDNVFVRAVELWIDGKLVRTKTEPPFDFETPDLPTGIHSIELVALDDVWTASRATAKVSVGALCASDDDCGDLTICAGGVCMSGPGVFGGLGTSCEYDTDCETRMCVDQGDGIRACSMPCNMGGSVCPAEFECSNTAGAPMCTVAQSGGCSAGGQTGSPISMLIFAAFALGLALRRSRA